MRLHRKKAVLIWQTFLQPLKCKRKENVMFSDVEACPSSIRGPSAGWRSLAVQRCQRRRRLTQTGHNTVIKERVKLCHFLSFYFQIKSCHLDAAFLLFLKKKSSTPLFLFFNSKHDSLLLQSRSFFLTCTWIWFEIVDWYVCLLLFYYWPAAVDALSRMSCDLKVCEDGLGQTKRMQECREMIYSMW